MCTVYRTNGYQKNCRFFDLVTFNRSLFASKTGRCVALKRRVNCNQIFFLNMQKVGYDLERDMGSCQMLAQFSIHIKFVKKI